MQQTRHKVKPRHPELQLPCGFRCSVRGLNPPLTYDNLKYHAKINLGTDEKRVVKLPGVRGNGSLFISESGLYKLVMRSDKPEAKGFHGWVTKVVIAADGLPDVASPRMSDT